MPDPISPASTLPAPVLPPKKPEHPNSIAARERLAAERIKATTEKTPAGTPLPPRAERLEARLVASIPLAERDVAPKPLDEGYWLEVVYESGNVKVVGFKTEKEREQLVKRLGNLLRVHQGEGILAETLDGPFTFYKAPAYVRPVKAPAE